jgi:hypothetical protein
MRELADGVKTGGLTRERIGEIAQHYDFRAVEG